MSEQVGEKFEFPELQTLQRLAANMEELKNQRDEERRDHSLKEKNRIKRHSIRDDFVHLATEALQVNPDKAREIVDTVSDLWTFGEDYHDGDFRSEVFGSFMREKMEEGLHKPEEHEKWIQTDYMNSMKFIERRMKIVMSLIEDGFPEFEEYLEFLRESRCKLKVRNLTFRMGDLTLEANSLKHLGNGMNKEEFWRELVTYIVEKTPAEIGGIDRVQGKYRITSSYPEDPERTYDSIRFGHKIVHQVEAEAFQYDLHTVLFIAQLERDLEVNDGQHLHYNRLGRWSRWRYTEAMCREAQRTYRPTIKNHTQEVAEKVNRVIATNGESLLEGPDENFAGRIDAVMKLFPQYKYQEVEDAEVEYPDEDTETIPCEMDDYEILPVEIYEKANQREVEYMEYAESCDSTIYEDPRTSKCDSTG